MNKGVVMKYLIFIILILTFLISFAFAATNDTNFSSTNSSTSVSSTGAGTGVNLASLPENADEKVVKGYQCLENLVKDKTTLALQEAVFSTLALGNKKNFEDKIN